MNTTTASPLQPPTPSTLPRTFRWVRVDFLILLLILGVGWGITVSYRALVIDAAQADYIRQTDLLTLSLAQGIKTYLRTAILEAPHVDYSALTEEAQRQFLTPLDLPPGSRAWLLRGSQFDILRMDSPDSGDVQDEGLPKIRYSISENAKTGGQNLNQYTLISVGSEQWLVGISTPYEAIMEESGATARIRTAFIVMFGITVSMLIVSAVSQRSRMAHQRTVRALAQATQDRDTEQRFAAALSDTTHTLAESLDLQTVLTSILENLHRVIPYDSASIFLLDGTTFRIASTQLNNLAVQHETVDNIPESIQPFWAAMRHDKAPRYVPNAEKQADWAVLPREEWVKSHIGYPVIINDSVQGVLNVNSTQPDYYQPHHLTQLERFAKQAAIALRNAQLYGQVQSLAGELQAKVASRTAELAAQNASLQALIDHMSDGLLFVDSATERVLYINPAFTALTGVEPGRIVGQPARDFTWMVADAAQVGLITRDFEQTTAMQQQWRSEIMLRTVNRGDRYCSLTGTIVRDAANAAIGYLILLRDISHEKALQEQKDAFITHASHELRNPVQNFKLRLHLLRQQPQRADEHMRVLQESANRLSRLIENLLDLSRFERGQIRLVVKPIDLVKLVHAVVNEYRPLIDSRRVNVDLQAAQPACPAHGDETRLMQVIENLLSNALNYTPEGGQVTVGVTAAAGSVTLTIRDTGAGIPPEALSRIFEPFYRVPNQTIKGNGIGLTITREIVALHGGRISVESTLGAGTTFTVWLPVSPAEISEG